MSIYRPARQYLPASMAAASLGAFSAWCATEWIMAAIPAVLFFVSAGLFYFLGSRPEIEVSEAGLRMGDIALRWDEIERIENTSWNAPLVLKLTLTNGKKLRLIYPGDVMSTDRLWRHIRREARAARREAYRGGPWDEPPGGGMGGVQRAPLSRLLRQDDEAEVERLYQHLKAVGSFDAPASDETRDDARS